MNLWQKIWAILEELVHALYDKPMQMYDKPMQTRVPPAVTPLEWTPPPQNTDPRAIEEEPNSTLITFCLAIKSREGFIAPCPQYPTGTPAYRNNNPANARYSPVGYLPIYGIVKKSDRGFAIFKDYDTGWLYLQNLVKEKIHMHPNESIFEFFQSYAPSSDGNDPRSYAAEVAKKCGLQITDAVSKVLIA